MDYSPIISQVFKLWWFIPIILLIALFKTPWFKGMLGEALVKLAAKLWLPTHTYQPIHNVTLQTVDGTTQIDHIFVSRYGVFVVETKHMQGWIFGSEKQAQWTQKIYKQSFKFQNPLRQNYKHVKAVEQLLDLPEQWVHSVIVFSGDSTFKTTMPANVTQGIGYIHYIKSFQNPVLTEQEVIDVVARIQHGRLSPTRETHREHVAHLNTRADVNASRICPRCGNAMVLRTRKRGSNAGKQFWGCSTYPRCKAMQNID